MDKEEINKLAAKFLEGTATMEEEALLHQWYDAQNPDREKMFVIHSTSSKEELGRRIQADLVREMFPPSGMSARRNFLRIAAAVLVLTLTSFGLYFLSRPPAIQWVNIEVPLGTTQKITLPDRSIAWVNAGSSLRYPEEFSAHKREVELINGQAFFDVTKDPDRPFHVVAGDVNVTVLGTSFDVKSYADEGSARVEVQTGQVEVRLPNRGVSEKLLPGKMAIIQKEEGIMEVVDKDSDYIGAWMEGRIVFYNEPMGSVFKALERNYNVSITTDDPEMLNAPLTIKLDKQPLGDILEVLKYIFDFEYKLNKDENTVKITKI